MATTSTMIGMLVCVLAFVAMTTAEPRWLPGNENLTAITEPPPDCPPAGTEVNATTLSNRYNCSQYYLCESGTPFLRNCPPGLHFNVLVGVCDFPWATTCEEIVAAVPALALSDDSNLQALSPLCRAGEAPACPPPPSVGNVTTCPDIYNCSQYWLCDNGVPKLTSCPPPLHYSVAIENCDFSWSASCVPASTTAAPTTTTKPTVASTTTVKTTTKAAAMNPEWPRALSPLCRAGEAPACPPPPSVGNVTTCPDIYNCSQYWLCDNGVPKLTSCPPPLHYSVAIENCDFSWSASCVPASTTAAPTTTTKPTLASTTTVKTTTKAAAMNPEWPRAISPLCRAGEAPACPPPPSVGNVTTCPDIYNCSQYWLCDNGVAKLTSCPPPLQYSVAIENCDFSWSASCVPASTTAAPTTTTKATTAATTKNREVPAPQVSQYCNVGGAPSCPPPSIGGNATFCPDTTNCTCYYICDNSGSHHRSCPVGLEFNIEYNTCDFPWAAQCTLGRDSLMIESPVLAPDSFMARISKKISSLWYGVQESTSRN